SRHAEGRNEICACGSLGTFGCRQRVARLSRLSLRLRHRNHGGEAIILPGNGGILSGKSGTQGLLRGMEPAPRSAQVKIRLRYVEDELLMGTGEGDVGDKRVCARGLQLGIASAEVEQ